MGEDPADHTRILNGREQAHAPPTARTREDIKLEGAPHQVGPGPVSTFTRGLAQGLREERRRRVGEGFPR